MRMLWSFTLLATFVFGSSIVYGTSPPLEEVINKDTRCPVCGMFVAKYPHWIAILQMSDGSVEGFDGVKDMMAFYFSPEEFTQKERGAVVEIRVKDYYTQAWLDGKSAFYVRGSDVLGPMGHELIPFATKPAAENFVKDHKGKELLSFELITASMIDMLRKGHKMKGHGIKHKK